MKTSCFHCDACGAMAEGTDDNTRPIGKTPQTPPEWVQVAITPYGYPSPIQLPSVFKDFCSAKCAANFLRASADRLEELEAKKGEFKPVDPNEAAARVAAMMGGR